MRLWGSDGKIIIIAAITESGSAVCRARIWWIRMWSFRPSTGFLIFPRFGGRRLLEPKEIIIFTKACFAFASFEHEINYLKLKLMRSLPNGHPVELESNIPCSPCSVPFPVHLIELNLNANNRNWWSKINSNVCWRGHSLATDGNYVRSDCNLWI